MTEDLRSDINCLVELCMLPDSEDHLDMHIHKVQLCAAKLATLLNSVLVGGSLYEQKRFAKIRLSDEIRALIDKDRTYAETIELNRRLLEAAYRRYIKRAEYGRTVWLLGVFPNPTPDAEKSVPNAKKRPRCHQLTWIRKVENGMSNERGNYDRVLRNIEFPLLPAESDPECKDTLDQRITRIREDLSDALEQQKRGLAFVERVLCENRKRES